MRLSILVAAALGAFALAAPLLVGCGSSDAGSPAGGGATVASGCASFASALCGRGDACAPFSIRLGYGDAATCAARVGARCVDTFRLTGVTLTPAALESCAASFASLSCADTLAGVQPAACGATGNRADGAACSAGSQCKGGACRTTTEGGCGTCVTPLAASATCDATKDLCAQGLFCSAATRCEAPAHSGEPCSATAPCAGGLFCDGAACAPLLGAGADCSAGQTCDAGAGLICNGVTKKCAATALAATGAACGLDTTNGDVTLCQAGAQCDFAAGHCVAQLKEGAACTLDPKTGTSTCTAGLQCVSGACTTHYLTCD